MFLKIEIFSDPNIKRVPGTFQQKIFTMKITSNGLSSSHFLISKSCTALYYSIGFPLTIEVDRNMFSGIRTGAGKSSSLSLVYSSVLICSSIMP